MQNKINEISKILNVHPKIVELLMKRGLTSVEEIDSFINLNINILYKALEFKPLQKVIECVYTAIENNYKVILYGDSDMDGIASTSIIYKTLRNITDNIEVIITEKAFSGYGVNFRLFEDKVSDKTLLIFLDVGTSDIDRLEEFKKQTNCSLVIIDHHENLNEEKYGVVIFNPKCYDNDIIANLTSSGLAVLVAFGLLANMGKSEQNTALLELFEIAALGTIADMGKLTGLNRVIVKLGLKSLHKPVNHGLQYLLRNEVRLFNDISVRVLAFRVIPRFNASCRMGNPRCAFDFLIEKDFERIKNYYEILTKYNEERRKEEQKVLNRENIGSKNYILLYGENWHPGIISSISTKLAMTHGVPTIIMTKVDNVWKGSARFPNGNILNMLKDLSDCLVKFGGHKEASGFEVDEKNFEKFLQKITDMMNKIKLLQSYEEVEVELELCDIDLDFINNLKKLEPFGIGNPWPIFKIKEANIYSVDENDTNLTIFLYSNAKILKGVAKKSIKSKLPSSQLLKNIICRIYYTNFNDSFLDNELSLEILDFN